MKDWYASKEITLLDILDGLLDTGVVVKGELVLSIANIDLVYMDLRLLITAVESIARQTDYRM